MKWAKRTWLSIIRRPFKTLLLFLVVFVMVTLLAGSLSIIMTSAKIKEQLSEDIGPEGTITMDYSYENPVLNEMFTYSFIENYIDTIDSLCANENVVSCEYHIDMMAQALFSDLWENENATESLPFSLYSTNVAKPASFQEGSSHLTQDYSGRYFTQEEIDNGEFVILTHRNLRSVTNEVWDTVYTGLCEVGNEVTLSVPVSYFYDVNTGETTVDYFKFNATVLGTFTGADDLPRIYIPDKAFMKILKEVAKEADNSSMSVYADYAAFKVKDLEAMHEFDDLAKETVSDLTGANYESSTTIYEKNAGPVENLDTIAKVIFVVALIATVVILSLVVIYFMQDRRKEIGIYASLGESKKNIISQLVLEVALVAVVAISAASASGLFLGSKLSDYMLEVQRYVQRQQDMGQLAKLPVIYKPLNSDRLNSRDAVIDNFAIEADAQYFVTLYAVGEITILISCGLSMIYLTKLHPKEIMM